MQRRTRLRRTALLCLHCLRNLAFYRATLAARDDWDGQQYWATASNNFLDVAVLEWCKLFAERNGKHTWKKSIGDQGVFESSLLENLDTSSQQFEVYVREIKTYRDKFVAHLDEDNDYQVPDMDPAIASAKHLYDWLIEKEDDCNAFPDAPESASSYFNQAVEHARARHAAA